MRSLLIVCVVACLALTAGMANAASPGQISDNTLSQMGLAGLQTMSDAQGTEIRGMGGLVVVSGTNAARLFGSTASNSYLAVSSPKQGSATANGNSTGTVNASLSIGPWVVGSIRVTAYGSAYGWAK